MFNDVFNDVHNMHIFTMQKYVGDKISASLSITGVEQLAGEKGISVLHRASILNWAGILKLPEALEYASKLVQEVISSGTTHGYVAIHTQVVTFWLFNLWK